MGAGLFLALIAADPLEDQAPAKGDERRYQLARRTKGMSRPSMTGTQ